MNYGLGFHAVVMLVLDDSGPVDWLPLLDDGGTVDRVPIVIAMALADGRTYTDRSDANTDLFCYRRMAREPTAAAINESFLWCPPSVSKNKPFSPGFQERLHKLTPLS
jgi:hypothetical protein